jgi:hypothetical protein
LLSLKISEKFGHLLVKMTMEITQAPRGLKLVKAVLDRASQLNMDPSEMADVLGYTDSYWKVIARGGRWIGSVGEDKLRLIADFLQLPLLTVYVLAEILNPRDFVYRPSLEKVFAETYQRLKSHGTLAVFAPSEDAWNKSPEETKLLCVYLLSRLMNDELIDLSKDQLDTRGATIL